MSFARCFIFLLGSGGWFPFYEHLVLTMIMSDATTYEAHKMIWGCLRNFIV